MDIRFKALIVAVMVSLIALNACNDNEYSELGVGTAEDQEIRFSVPEVQSGRAIETTSSLNSNGKQVMVYGVMHEGEWNGSNMKEIDNGALLDNVILTHNGTRWDYSPKAYWPQGENQYVSFFSFYPISNDGYVGLTKQIEFIEDNNSFALTVKRNENKAIDQDILYAVTPNMNRSKDGGNVNLSYNHALAKLNFSVKLGGDISSESNFTISSITLSNYRGAANITYNSTNGLTFDDMAENQIMVTNLFLSDENLYFNSGQKMDLEAQLMLPQSLTEDACYGETPILSINYSAVINGQSVSRELSYDLVNSFEAWESGKAYSYVLSVDLTSINVTCTVNDFVDGGVSDGIIPEVVIPKPAEIEIVDEIIDMIAIPYDASRYTGGEYSFPITVIYDAFGLDEESYNTALELDKFEFYGESADGTLHASNTNGYGCWFGENQTCLSWGRDARVFLEGNTLNSFIVAQYPGQTEIGVTYPTSHLIIYNNGRERNAIRMYLDVKVVAPPFVMPEPDYVLEVDVAQDNGYAATYFSLDGTEVDGWGKYSDANKYVTTIQDVSVDITSEIESALGLEEGELEDAINAGEVLLGAYGFDENGEVCFMDCYERITGNYFYWFDNEGFITTWGNNAYVVVDNIGFHSSQVQLYGTVALFPNAPVIGSTYSGYIIFRTDDGRAEYIVEIKCTVVVEPEEHPLPEFEIVEVFEFRYEGINPGAYVTPDPIFSLEDWMSLIRILIEGDPDMLLMGKSDGSFQDWTVTDGWFGVDGVANWGSQDQMFCLKPVADGTFSYCGAINDGPVNCKCKYRYANSATNKAVDVEVIVALTE